MSLTPKEKFEFGSIYVVFSMLGIVVWLLGIAGTILATVAAGGFAIYLLGRWLVGV